VVIIGVNFRVCRVRYYIANIHCPSIDLSQKTTKNLVFIKVILLLEINKILKNKILILLFHKVENMLVCIL